MSETNIVSVLLNSINSIFSNLISSINTNIYDTLDNLIFINVDILDSNISNILGSKVSVGITLICNSLLYGLLLYYGFSLLFSYFTFSEVQKPSSFIFKVFLCAIAINSTELICHTAILLNSVITSSIKLVGQVLFETPICFNSLIETLNSSIYTGTDTFNLFSFNGLIKGFVTIGFINLAISYALRYVMIKVFILICPFAILSLAFNKFSWIFKSWIKIFLSQLFLQILVSLILLVTFSLEYTVNDILSQLIYIGAIYSLIKANSFIRDFMGGLSTDINFGISSIKSLFSGGG